jgi:hypothetical protein
MDTKTTATAVAETNTHTEGLNARLAELRAMRGNIPYFEIPTAGATARVATAATVPQEFIELTVSMLGTGDVVLKRKPDMAAIRDRIAFADSYGPLADEFDLMAQALRHSMIAARSKAGRVALEAYGAAKLDAKSTRDGEMLARVADLSRALGARRRNAKAKLAAAKQQAEVEKARAEGIARTPAGTAPKQ